MNKEKWMLLQLFAGEGGGSAAGSAGDGGAQASATVDTGADDGHQRLLELGVPANKLRNRAKKAEAKLPEGAVRSTQPAQEPEQKPQEQVAAAEQPTEEKQEAKRLTWDEIMQDPEYNRQMQSTIQERLRKSKGAEETLAKITPALEIMARAYGMDTGKLDYEALAGKISADDKLYEEKAMQMGVSPDVARKLDQFDMMQARQQEEKAKSVQENAMRQHYTGLLRQAEALKQKIPGFDLQKELQNPAFYRMTAPGRGVMSVEDAYNAVHRKEIQQAAMQVAEQQTAQKISNAIQAGAKRPEENGTASSAPSVTTFDYRNASKAQRDALKKAIREAGAKGEKLYPGR